MSFRQPIVGDAAWRNRLREGDRQDPLASFKEEFSIPAKSKDRSWTYLCGNSLGLMPRAVPHELQTALDAWANLGVEGHFEGLHPWMDYHKRFTGPLARLTGSLESEVVACNTLTVNLHLLMAGFYRPEPGRKKILIEAGAFPSDQYAMDSQIRHHRLDPQQCLIEVGSEVDRHTDPTLPLLEAIRQAGSELAVVLIGAVHYYSGASYEVAALAREAHKVGAVLGLDLAHAVGNVPLNLHQDEVDFACWCSYKYLNSGPGGPGGLFVHQKHHLRQDLGRLEGWWGHHPDTRFAMPRRFEPAPGAEAWQLSNAQVLAMAPHAAALDLHDRAGMSALRRKSLQLTAELEHILLDFVQGRPELEGSLITPSNPERRGCQLSLKVTRDGARLFEHLHRSGILADWRNPDTVRMAPVPLYNRFEDLILVYEALQAFP